MRMLHVICSKILRGVSNETIRKMTGMKKIKELQREQGLSWFEDVERMNDERALINAKNFVVNDSKKGRSKKRWRL